MAAGALISVATDGIYMKPVAAIGAASLVDGSGAVIPAASDYLSNTTVNVTAIPSDFHSFTSWQGDLGGSINPSPVIMESHKSVNGKFDAITVTNGVPQWWLFQH